MPKFTIDFRFVFLERELWALGEFLKTIEPQVKYLCEQDRARTDAELSGQGLQWDDADVLIAHQEMSQRELTVYPRLLRNPFLVSLWAAYESGVAEIARDLAASANLRLSLKDIRGNHFLDGAVKYYTEVIHSPLDLDQDRLARLNDLRKIRNAIAHGNGDRRWISTRTWRAIEPLVERMSTVSISHEYLIVSPEYLAQAYEDVNDSLTDLIARVRGPSVREVGTG